MTALWFRMDVDFAENEKVNKVPVAARWFHVAALCYCARNLTDGHINTRAVKVIAAVCETTARRWPVELVNAGLWNNDTAGDGFWINDYLKHQPTRAEMKDLAEKRSQAGRAGGLASGKVRQGNAQRFVKQTVEQTAEPQTDIVGVNPQRQPTTWQPALGHRNPAANIRRQIDNGALTEIIALEAELASEPSLTAVQCDELRTHMKEKAA